MDKGHTILVLDRGYVTYEDHLGSDRTIVGAARLSYRAGSKGDEADKKLLRYLWTNKHTSPFEMVKIVLKIKMPIFVMRQYVRHRMQNLNEVSARYTELPDSFYVPTSWRKQAEKGKQQSVETKEWPPNGPYLDFGTKTNDCPSATDALHEHHAQSYKLYQAMLSAGIAREMARMVLPVSIYTEIISCWDLKNLLHFISLRDDSHAQAEIQEYGRAIKQILKEIVPWTMEIYEELRNPPTK